MLLLKEHHITAYSHLPSKDLCVENKWDRRAIDAPCLTFTEGPVYQGEGVATVAGGVKVTLNFLDISAAVIT